MMQCPNCGAENPPGAYACVECGAQFQAPEAMPAAQTGEPPGVAMRQSSGYQPATAEAAGFWVRFLAILVDGLVLGIVLGPLEGAAVASNSVSFITAGSILAVLIVYTYNILMVWRFQATVGKMALGIKVFNTDGTAPGFGTAFVREISKILSALCCYIGFIWAGFDADKQAWHDKIAKTYVLYTR
jgi:uncharacterized RDD family membrane protein YckC